MRLNADYVHSHLGTNGGDGAWAGRQVDLYTVSSFLIVLSLLCLKMHACQLPSTHFVLYIPV